MGTPGTAPDRHSVPADGEGGPSWRRRVALLSVVSAIAVSVPFVPQPLLGAITAEFGVSVATAGLVATSAQVGAAVGILLTVPLADVIRSRPHLMVQVAVAALAMVAAAFAPGPATLCAAMGVTAAASVVAQVVLPLALRQAPAGERARTAATLGGSLLFGIFGGRLAAGILAAQVGWRLTLVAYALLLVGSIACLWFAVSPADRPSGRLSYGRLLASLPRLAVASPAICLSAVAQGLIFAAFNGLWSVMALHLMTLDRPWDATQAGLVNLVGLGAGVVAVLAGPSTSRLGPGRTLAVTLPTLVLASLAIAITGPHVALMLTVLLLLSAANQVSHVANQTRALSAHLESAGRANTVYMLGTMLGGAMGAAVGTAAFAEYGLGGTALFGTCCIVVAAVAVIVRDRAGAAVRRRGTTTDERAGSTAGARYRPAAVEPECTGHPEPRPGSPRALDRRPTDAPRDARDR